MPCSDWPSLANLACFSPGISPIVKLRALSSFLSESASCLEEVCLFGSPECMAVLKCSVPKIHTPCLLRVLYVLAYLSPLAPVSLAPYIYLPCKSNELFWLLFSLSLGLGETDISLWAAPNRLEHCIKVFVISLVCWRQLGRVLPPIIDQDFTLQVREEVSVRKNTVKCPSSQFWNFLDCVFNVFL